ncbi:MAG: tetratricopeptide repeat protein [bacterium]
MRGKYIYAVWFLVTAAFLFSVSVSLGTTLTQSTAESYYHQGNQYLDQGMYELAIPEYQAALQADPKYRPAYRKLGDAYRYLKNYTSAIDNYLKFVNLSTDTADAEGKQLLIDTAKLCDEINDSENALRTIDGLLRYYYPESFDKVDMIFQKYRESYSLSIQTIKNINCFHRTPDPYWQKAMFLKGNLLRKYERKQEAFDVFSQYYALIRYRDLILENTYLPEEWIALYLENMAKPIPEDWQECPWVIVLSPENPEYRVYAKENKRIEIITGTDLERNLSYIIQAKPGFRISKMKFNAEIEQQGINYVSYPFGAIEKGYDYAAPINLFNKITFNKESTRHWAQYLFENKTGVHALRFQVLNSDSSDKWYQWNIQAEFVPESDLAVNTTQRESFWPRLIIRTHPFAVTHVILDDKMKMTIQDIYGLTLSYSSAGWHTLVAERPGLPNKETKFYWDFTQDYFVDVGFNINWNRNQTNLSIPKNTSELRLYQDNNGIYRLILVASPDGQSDIYTASSQDLLNWLPLEKLSINSWKKDEYPRLFHNAQSGMFTIIWISDRAIEPTAFVNSDVWISTSADFQNWSRPTKMSATPKYIGSFLFGGFNLLLDKTDRYWLFSREEYSVSNDGISWSTCKPIKLSEPIEYISGNYCYHLLSNGSFIRLYKTCTTETLVFISDNGIDYRKIGIITSPKTQFKFACPEQIIELKDNIYGGLFKQGEYLVLSKSKDLVHWDEPQEILSVFDMGISNLIKDPQDRLTFLSFNGELWSTPDLK